MKAVTFQGPFKLEVKDVPDPTIQEPNDIILKVTTAGICGSDVHAYDGRMTLPPTGWSMGHEYIGEVVEVGPGVTNFKPGDRAVGSFVASCGDCYYCQTGWPSQCEKQQFFGFILLGGAQAEYLRVPNGHYTLEKVPDGLSDEKAVFTGDILSTGYFCADRGEIKPGDVVAVVGSGPVGLFAQMSALMFEPKVVLAIDSMPERLEMSSASAPSLSICRASTRSRPSRNIRKAEARMSSWKQSESSPHSSPASSMCAPRARSAPSACTPSLNSPSRCSSLSSATFRSRSVSAPSSATWASSSA